jgi:hypothetical protein
MTIKEKFFGSTPYEKWRSIWLLSIGALLGIFFAYTALVMASDLDMHRLIRLHPGHTLAFFVLASFTFFAGARARKLQRDSQ